MSYSYIFSSGIEFLLISKYLFLWNFRTILYVSIIYAIGNVTVAVTSIPAVLAKVKT